MLRAQLDRSCTSLWVSDGAHDLSPASAVRLLMVPKRSRAIGDQERQVGASWDHLPGVLHLEERRASGLRFPASGLVDVLSGRRTRLLVS